MKHEDVLNEMLRNCCPYNIDEKTGVKTYYLEGHCQNFEIQAISHTVSENETVYEIVSFGIGRDAASDDA